MEKVILVGVNVNEYEFFEESMKELKGLAEACNFKVVGSMSQNLKVPNKVFYIGKGKIEALKVFIEEHESKIVIFNNELSPLQFKNLEESLNVTVIDRTLLILNIFASRAKTKEAKLQVEVARLNYLLPRLVDSDANLEQQSGGAAHNKGSGEKQIDLNKRNLRKRISQLENELDELALNRETQRKKRLKNDIPLVALCGYTNAGKSTLLNAFIEQFGVNGNQNKTVMTKDMLFATLDTTTRYIKFKDNKDILLSDTVGFISNLPTGLIRAFKSTLAEVIDADLIIIVADISSPEMINQIQVTQETLKEIGVNGVPVIYAFNKADKIGLAGLPADENRIFISAKNRINLNLLEKEIKQVLFRDWKKCKMFIPYKESRILSYLNEHCNVIKQDYEDEGTIVEVELSAKDYNELIDYVWISNSNS